MKISKTQLKQIIKEEYERMTTEMKGPIEVDPTGEPAGRGVPEDEFTKDELGRLQSMASKLIQKLESEGKGDKLAFAKKFVRNPRDYSGAAAVADLSDMIGYLESL